MGREARARGTYEERKAAAIERDRLAAEAREQERRITIRSHSRRHTTSLAMLFTAIGMGVSFYGDK